MKTEIGIGALLLAACSLCAQGTVQLANSITGTLSTRVYGSTWIGKVGNGTGDFPSGTTDWTGFVLLTGSGYRAAILAANGAGVAESSLTFGSNPTTTTFRGGFNAGHLAGTTAILSQVPPDAARATVELFVWDTQGGTVNDPVIALAGWYAGIIGGGKSGAFTVADIGGSVNTPPVLMGLQSFSIFPVSVPEPSALALIGLGAAALSIFRRRK